MAQKLMFPMKTLNVSQGYGVSVEGVAANTFSHKGTNCIDICGKDTGQQYTYAMCDCVVKRIYNGNTASSKCNFTWYESTAPVQTRKHGLVYVNWIQAHCNNEDITKLGIRVGKVFKQGEICGREGTAGKATGNHVHISLGIGKFQGTGWYKTSSGNWQCYNPAYLNQECYLAADTDIIRSGGYNWVKLSDSTSTVTPPTTGSSESTYTKGAAVRLINDKLYTASSGTSGVTKSGVFYIYDGKLTNGRYRVTNNPRYCNDKTLNASHVSGWVIPSEVDSVSNTTSSTAPYIGKPVKLSGQKLYTSSTGTTGYTKYQTYYIYDNAPVNNRYRVTNSTARVYKGTFVASNVSGWVDASLVSK